VNIKGRLDRLERNSPVPRRKLTGDFIRWLYETGQITPEELEAARLKAEATEGELIYSNEATGLHAFYGGNGPGLIINLGPAPED
jgi:hypothetical protein